MDEVAAPGILAYKGGDCFANLVSIINEIPSGKDINSATLEGVLQLYVKHPSGHGAILLGSVMLTLWPDTKFYDDIFTLYPVFVTFAIRMGGY